ncbi:MAG: VWA domain-containing protein [Opitutaceae bacterium]|nr:VWA domain-containing protein [Opitutaceae bacterium]
MDYLRLIFFPFSKNPAGDASSALIFEGIRDVWALLLLIVVGVLTWWAHRYYLSHMPAGRRRWVASLRILFFALLIFVLMRPVIVTTLIEDVRQRLIVLVDDSKSMGITDNRTTPEDRQRVEIASGKLAPDFQVNSTSAANPVNVPRAELLNQLATNSRLDLWAKLGERADLAFYRFGADAVEAPSVDASPTQAARNFFATTKADQSVSAIGDSLRQVLSANRGQPIAGVLVITDGANNRGMSPAEAVSLARQDNIPVFVYGVGVAEPKDIVVRGIDAPRLGFLNEKINVRVSLKSNGFEGQPVKVDLHKEGSPVSLASKEVNLPAKGSTEIDLTYTATEAGIIIIEASVPAQPGEVSDKNNAATAKVRIIDQRIKVFMVEQEPRWDYRYLLDFLQDDRRLALKVVLLDGDPSLTSLPGSVFLPGMPDDRDQLYKSDILLLGDADPARLGTERMKLIRDWVDQDGGGLVFLAGQKSNPQAYLGTPLETLLPVIPPRVAPPLRDPKTPAPSIKIMPTAAGRRSPIVTVSENPATNLKEWAEFAPVHWIAEGVRARTGAEVLLETKPDKPGEASTPVLVRQRVGRGQVIYVGFEETYRWRSKTGQKYYAQIWGKLLQALSLDRLEGASKQVQLKPERADYELGERVVISGKLFNANFTALIADQVPAELTGPPSDDGKASKPTAITLVPVAQEPGSYRFEFTPTRAGKYSLVTPLDPTAPVEVEVGDARLEQTETALNLDNLNAMAKAAGGKLYREENLHTLADNLKENAGKVSSIRRLNLYASPVLMGLIFLLLGLEWIIRRLSRLK